MNKIFSILLFAGALSCGPKRVANNVFIIRQDDQNLNQDSTYKAVSANNWITFDSTTTSDFSESFKKQLSEDLSKKLHDLFKNEVSGPVSDFHLTIGASVYEISENNKPVAKPFEIIVNDNYAVANVGISTAFAQLYSVSIAWTSSEFKNPEDIHKSDITHKDVNFYWCNDFPREKIIADLAPTQIRMKSETGYKFDVKYYLKVFPDVTIYFEFAHTPSKEALDELQAEAIKFRDKFKTVFVHEMTEYHGYYTISINHNTIDYDTYTGIDFEADVNNLDFFLKNIDSNPRITGLTQVVFL